MQVEVFSVSKDDYNGDDDRDGNAMQRVLQKRPPNHSHPSAQNFKEPMTFKPSSVEPWVLQSHRGRGGNRGRQTVGKEATGQLGKLHRMRLLSRG